MVHSSSRRVVALVFLAGLFVYGYRLWDAPLDRTEPHRALVAHQMVLSGDWLVPHLNGEVYLRKPPLIYWIEAASERLTGHAQPWAWRLPSAVGSACLAAVVAAWAGRWFGAAAVGPAGVAVLALVPLWDQDRAADIDALNTVAAVVTALMALELIYGPRRRVWPWVIGLAVSTAAMLLLKGPGGLPPLIGALVGPSIVLHSWRWARRPGVWIGLAVGVAAFVAWAVAAKAAVRHAGAATDTRGVREALERLVLHRPRDVLPALLAPAQVLLYAVPVALAVPFAVILARRDLTPSPVKPRGGGGEGGFGELTGVDARNHPHPNPLPGYRERGPERIIALLATVGAGLALFVLAGNRNPRYEYVLLPLLGLIVGAVAAGRDQLSGGERTALRFGLAAMALLWSGLQSGATALVWRAGIDHAGLVTAGVVSGLALFGWFRLGRPVVLAGVVVAMLAVPLVDRKNLERQRRSTLGLAAPLRAVVGGGPVVVASENWDVPELFHYAGVPVQSFGEAGLAKLAAGPGGRWVVLGQTVRFPEYRTVTSQVPGAFPRGVTTLKLPKGDTLYVGWYDPPAGASRAVHVPPVAPDGAGDED